MAKLCWKGVPLHGKGARLRRERRHGGGRLEGRGVETERKGASMFSSMQCTFTNLKIPELRFGNMDEIHRI
jgi:hypothetical protein